MTRLHLATAAMALLAQAGVGAEPVHNWTEVSTAPAGIKLVVPDGPADAMNGARVTVSFSDGSTDTALFVGRDASPSFLSVAQTPAFALVAQSSGSTASFPSFTLSNTDLLRTLVGFQIDGRGDGYGVAAFDRGTIFSTRPSTVGSSTGIDLSLDFRDRSFLSGTVEVIYSQPLGLAGAAPVGDLFGSVAVQMNLSRVFGLPPNSNLSFIKFSTDIDFVQYAAVAVPEPGTWALMATGVGLLAWRSRR